MTVYFYLKKNVPEIEQPIMCRIQCGATTVNGKSKPDLSAFTTKISCTKEMWDNKAQRIVGRSVEVKRKNQELLELENRLAEIKEDCDKIGRIISANFIKNTYMASPEKTIQESKPLHLVFADYVRRMEVGEFLKPNGRRFGDNTIVAWKNTGKIIDSFVLQYNVPDFAIHNFDVHRTTYLKRDLVKFYIEFYQNFKKFCLDKGLKDNTINIYTTKIKTLFNYLQKKEFVNLNNVHLEFYSSADHFDIIALPENMFFSLVKNYEDIRRMVKAKNQLIALDYIILGGTVALRKSDMLSLNMQRLQKQGNSYILSATTKKTETPIQFPLPEFLTKVIDRNLLQYKRPFPKIQEGVLNGAIKLLCKKIPAFHNEIEKYRVVNGEKKLIGSFPIHELVCPHMLRRTAVSNMLAAGVPVNVIKAVGGWEPASKTFEQRYLAFNQAHANQEITRYYDKIESYVRGEVA
jgi:integrase